MVRVTCTRAECFATRGSAPIACPHQTVLCSDTPILGHRGKRSSSLSGTRTRAPIHQIMSAGMLAIAAGYATADAREVFRATAGEIIVETIANASASQACLKYLVETAIQKRSSCPGSRGQVSAETRLSPILSEPPPTHARVRARCAASPSMNVAAARTGHGRFCCKSRRGDCRGPCCECRCGPLLPLAPAGAAA